MCVGGGRRKGGGIGRSIRFNQSVTIYFSSFWIKRTNDPFPTILFAFPDCPFPELPDRFYLILLDIVAQWQKWHKMRCDWKPFSAMSDMIRQFIPILQENEAKKEA